MSLFSRLWKRTPSFMTRDVSSWKRGEEAMRVREPVRLREPVRDVPAIDATEFARASDFVCNKNHLIICANRSSISVTYR